MPDAGGKLLMNETGAHRLTVMDEAGRHHSVRFTVDALPGI
jgi:penicillin-binding protein 1C